VSASRAVTSATFHALKCAPLIRTVPSLPAQCHLQAGSSCGKGPGRHSDAAGCTASCGGCKRAASGSLPSQGGPFESLPPRAHQSLSEPQPGGAPSGLNRLVPLTHSSRSCRQQASWWQRPLPFAPCQTAQMSRAMQPPSPRLRRKRSNSVYVASVSLCLSLSLSLSDTWVGERRVSCGSSRSWRTHEENSTDCTSSATRKALVDVHKVNRPKQTIHSTLGRDGKPCHVSFLHLINFQCTNELGFFRLQLLFLEGKERREVGGSLV